MPTMTCGSSSTMSVRPTTAASPANRSRHNALLRTTTGVAFSRVGFAEKPARGGCHTQHREPRRRQPTGGYAARFLKADCNGAAVVQSDRADGPTVSIPGVIRDVAERTVVRSKCRASGVPFGETQDG